MSNLGMYQKITTWSKKVGGPARLVLCVAGVGYVVGKAVEIPVKKGIKYIKSRINTKLQTQPDQATYTVVNTSQSNEGVEFCEGTKFRVWARDKDSVLVEIIGDDNSPFYVSYDWLHSISDYTAQTSD